MVFLLLYGQVVRQSVISGEYVTPDEEDGTGGGEGGGGKRACVSTRRYYVEDQDEGGARTHPSIFTCLLSQKIDES